MHRKLIAVSLVVAMAAVLAGCSRDSAPAYQGYVEGEYVHLASPLGGRLEHLFVQRGQSVGVGARVFALEAQEESTARQQADEQVKAAQAQLADLRLGRRTPEVDVAQAQLAQARAAEEQAAQQVRRDEAQLAAGGIARAQLDDSRADHSVKAARVKELAGQLSVARLPAREHLIRAQMAQLEAARAVASQAQWRFDQKQVSAAQAALVADTLYREGEWVPAGSPVVRLLPPQNVKIRFFVPEPVVGGLRPGRKVALHCDGCESGLQGEVSFIASEAEYTPPVIYSNETRAKLVFMIEARPAPGQAQRLHPGLPVSVTLP
ncbi:HlyD family efflux transporter periplasmic adaptor subunit [Ramlibacter solisilvae]|uniref:HlyD family secretion protein n=1 Tax=Ramlibacter tataouinensis TaxID=94132 RepID=A0A127JQD8_9BURK|nr:HlyD family efflux transporter periplasmic adaptor subunit [Ramlibacter tataouinensis]AMO22211.1 HlyD family secretion protein [Ramlibacter tataouinensis]